MCIEPHIRENPEEWSKLMRDIHFNETALNIVKYGSKYLFVPAEPHPNEPILPSKTPTDKQLYVMFVEVKKKI